MTDQEIWIVVDGYPDYAVSNFGRIKRLTSRTCAKAGTILKQARRSKKSHYMAVNLCRDGADRLLQVHRLVARTFLGEPDEGIEVNHKDGDKGNNRLTNLEYATSSENQKHAYEMGLQSAAGELNGQAILSEEQVVSIKRRWVGRHGQQSELARQYGVSPSTIRDIVKGRTWTHVTLDADRFALAA